MIIDSHLAVPPDFSRSSVKIFEKVTAEFVLDLMNKLGVESSVVLTVAREPDDVSRCNDWNAKLMRDHPGKFLGFANVYPPRVKEALAELDRAITKLNLVGLKLHPRVQRFQMADPSVMTILERAKEYDIPVIFHVTSPAYLPFPAHLGEFAQDLADLDSNYSASISLRKIIPCYNSRKLIAAHMGGLYRPEISLGGILSQTERSNISFQTTGVCTEAIEHAYRTVGPNRILYGSDSPFFDPADEIAKVNRANIPEDAKKKIFSENIKKILGL